MTTRQIQWAKSHDWFYAPTKDGQGVICFDRYTTPDGKSHEELVTHRDYRELRDWAGY